MLSDAAQAKCFDFSLPLLAEDAIQSAEELGACLDACDRDVTVFDASHLADFFKQLHLEAGSLLDEGLFKDGDEDDDEDADETSAEASRSFEDRDTSGTRGLLEAGDNAEFVGHGASYRRRNAESKA